MSVKLPLNGTKTHPLTEHALGVLNRLVTGPLPRLEMNPGTANRLEREDLVEWVRLPSPYKKDQCAAITFGKITDAGRAALKSSEPKP